MQSLLHACPDNCYILVIIVCFHWVCFPLVLIFLFSIMIPSIGLSDPLNLLSRDLVSVTGAAGRMKSKNLFLEAPYTEYSRKHSIFRHLCVTFPREGKAGHAPFLCVMSGTGVHIAPATRHAQPLTLMSLIHSTTAPLDKYMPATMRHYFSATKRHC